MGEDSEPLITEAVLRRTNRAILINMAGVVAFLALACAAIYGLKAAIGVIVGGILAWINFRWLDSSTRAMLMDPIAATTPILAMKYVFRYLLITGVIVGVWYYDLLPVVAVIAGLASFGIAAFIRGITSTLSSSQ